MKSSNWFDFSSRTFIPENMCERTRKTYENHLAKLAIIISLLAQLASTSFLVELETKILSFIHVCHHTDGKRASKLAGIASISTSDCVFLYIFPSNR